MAGGVTLPALTTASREPGPDDPAAVDANVGEVTQPGPGVASSSWKQLPLKWTPG